MKKTIIRSDARTLHVDFENVVDSLITARNAGVILDHGTKARILNDFAFQGRRCAHIAVSAPNQATRLQLVRAFDALPARDNAVLEFVYRPALDQTVALKNWPIIRCFAQKAEARHLDMKDIDHPVFGQDGVLDCRQPVGIELRAIGSKRTGKYQVDVVHRDGKQCAVLADVDQFNWLRFIAHRRNHMVDLFAGLPGVEQFIGTYPDIKPDDEIFSILLGNPDEPKTQGSGYWDVFRLGRPRKKSGKVASAEPRIRHVGQAAPKSPRIQNLGREKHLLIDDWSVAHACNIRRTFHRPVKHGKNPLIMADKPWELIRLYLFGGAERHANGQYRMWYCPPDPIPSNPKNAHTCVALSDDGITWTKPALGLHSYKRHEDTNIAIKNAGVSLVFKNSDDPRPDFRYLATVRHHGTLGWSSPDGLHWTNHGVILPQSLDASSCHWDPVRKKYIGSIKLGLNGRRVRGYAESDDFLHWSDTYLMADVDDLDLAGDEIYNMKIFRYENLYLGMCKILHNTTSSTCDIQLATSHNCMHWQRLYRTPDRLTYDAHGDRTITYTDPDTQPFIPAGPLDSWDFGNLECVASAPIRHGDELRFYYGGYRQRHPPWPSKGRPSGAIGLATLRLDGFVSAGADSTGGTIVTKPLRLKGRQLYVNANAIGGTLRTEILDSKGKSISGFDLASARAIRSDRVRIRCGWKKQTDLSALSNRVVRLKFHFKNSCLYAFWME